MAEIKRTLSTNGAARFDLIDAEVAEEGMYEVALEKAITEWKNNERGEDFVILWLPVRCESVCCDAWGAPDWVAVPIGASRARWLHRESGRLKANGLLYAASAWALEAHGGECRTPDVRLVFDDEYIWIEGHVGDGPEFHTESYTFKDLFGILGVEEDAFLASGGNVCPVCKNSDISFVGSWESDSGWAWRDAECASCGASWTEDYRLEAYEVKGGAA